MSSFSFEKIKKRKTDKDLPKGSYKVGGSSASGVKRPGVEIEEREVEAKDEKDLADGKSDIDDPLEIENMVDAKEVLIKSDTPKIISVAKMHILNCF